MTDYHRRLNAIRARRQERVAVAIIALCLTVCAIVTLVVSL